MAASGGHSARQDVPVYLCEGSLKPVMHRPHGTLQRCNLIEDTYAPVHRINNSRFFKDVRLVPSEASRKKGGAQPAPAERRAQPSVPKESQAEGFVRMERRQSSVKAPSVAESGPFRTGGRVGGSGAPGFRAMRNGGRPGDGMWNPLVDEQINCAREVRERLHAKNSLGYTPLRVLPFHE